MDKSTSFSKFSYIFGNRLFIGVIKFYDSKKEYGYIVSNNYGMNHHSKFKSDNLDFFFDMHSFQKLPSLSSLVIFQPAWVNGKLKAVNVRAYSFDFYKELALEYYNNNNFICYSAYEKVSDVYGRKEVKLVEHKISILLRSGITRYEIIEEICSQYNNKGEEYLLDSINKLVHAAGGNKKYYETLTSYYSNQEKEINALRRLFKILDEEIIIKILSVHSCFQNYIPVNILKQNIDLAKEEYGIPLHIIPFYREKELRDIIEHKEVFKKYYPYTIRELYKRPKKIVDKCVENLLLACPAEHRAQLTKIVNDQMKESICEKIDSLQSLTKDEKERLLSRYSAFINDEQKTIIETSIKEDIIHDIKNDCMSFVQKDKLKVADISMFLHKNKCLFNKSTKDIKEAVIFDIETSFSKALEIVLSNLINSCYNKESFDKLYNTLQECELLGKHIIQHSLKRFQESVIVLFKKSIYNKKCSSVLISDVKKYTTKENYRILMQTLYEEIAQNESLNIIYYFINNVYDEIPEHNIEYFLEHKEIDELIDFGEAFWCQKDHGLSLVDKIFEIVFNNTDFKGNFIINNNQNGCRANFLGYFIYILARYNDSKLDYYLQRLSYQDRILLSAYRIYGLDIATSDDIQKELLSEESYKTCYPYLQRFRNAKTAIIDIICSMSSFKNIIINDVIAWIRLYLDIYERKFNNEEQKDFEEQRLIKAIQNIEGKCNVNFSPYGINTSTKTITPSYEELEECEPFIEFIWQCNIRHTKHSIQLESNKDIFHLIDSKFINYIENLLQNSFVDNGNTYAIECSNIANRNILAFITMNVLNNTNNIKNNIQYDNVLCFENNHDITFISHLNSIINMTAKDGMDAFWRVGDRGDIETYYKDVEISFTEHPEKIIVGFLEKNIPEISQEESTTKYSYHFKESEIAKGYGRSYDYDNSINYKNELLKPIIKDMYLAYKKGLFFE